MAQADTPSEDAIGQAGEAVHEAESQVDKTELTDEQRAEIHARNGFVRACDRALTDLRQRSYEGKLTTSARWKKLALAPEGVAADEFEERLLDYIEDHDHAEDSPAMGEMEVPKPLDVQLEGKKLGEDDPLPDPDVSDIVILYGKKGVYLYSKPLMSHSFAHALFLSIENDDVTTFLDVVRNESKVYPRPTTIDAFMNAPYLWPRDKTRKIFSEVEADGAFKDIHVVLASNRKEYYYSDLYLSEAQAQSLAEWYEIGKQANP